MDETSEMDDFFDGMTEDYQTEDTEQETESTNDTAEEESEATQETQEEPVAEENSDGTDEPPAEEKPADADQETHTYVLRVNHQDKTVTREEMMSFAQKGVDYDRVKTQLEQAKSDNSGLQSQIDEMRGVFDVINDLAKASNVPVSDLLKSFRKTRYTTMGYSEKEAELAVERDDIAKERDSLRGQDKPLAAEEDSNARANREVAEFQQKFPDVNLSEELVNKLMPDCNKGMSLTDAYQKMQRDEQAATIARLEAELAAEKQNAANRKSSPGSLKDSGKKKAHDQYDDFFDQF